MGQSQRLQLRSHRQQAPGFSRPALEEGAINNGADDRSIKVVASTGAGAAISDLERTTATVIDYPSRTLFGYGYYVSSSLVEPDDTAAGGDPLPTLPRVIGPCRHARRILGIYPVSWFVVLWSQICPQCASAHAYLGVKLSTYRAPRLALIIRFGAVLRGFMLFYRV